jgi:hypothetical protein
MLRNCSAFTLFGIYVAYTPTFDNTNSASPLSIRISRNALSAGHRTGKAPRESAAPFKETGWLSGLVSSLARRKP